MDRNLITADMKIYDIVKKHPELMDVLIVQAPKFEKLKNKMIFNTMAKVASLNDVAKIGGLEINDLLLTLNGAIGVEESTHSMNNQDTAKQENDNTQNNDSQENKNLEDFKRLFDKNNFEEIDARDLGDNPFSKIIELAGKIPEGYGFCLVQKFEPVPIYNILKNKGFEHATEKISEDEYRVFFQKKNKEGKIKG